MLCHVYRSERRELTYLYLDPELAWESLPQPLQELFKDAERVMELELSKDRPLAQENVETVLANLADPGYHLQLPPKDDPSGWLDLPKKKGF